MGSSVMACPSGISWPWSPWAYTPDTAERASRRRRAPPARDCRVMVVVVVGVRPQAKEDGGSRSVVVLVSRCVQRAQRPDGGRATCEGRVEQDSLCGTGAEPSDPSGDWSAVAGQTACPARLRGGEREGRPSAERSMVGGMGVARGGESCRRIGFSCCEVAC